MCLEAPGKKWARLMELKSLCSAFYLASADICAGDTFTSENIRIVRPGFGAPRIYILLLLAVSLRLTTRGTPLSLENLL